MGCSSSRQQEDVGPKVAPNQESKCEEEDDDVFVCIRNADSEGVLPHAARSRKGMVPYNPRKVNQDRALLHYALQNDPSMSLWSVMDGHGEYGHLVASFVQSRLASCVESQVDLRTRPEVSLTAAVARLTEDLAHTDLNIAFSGTTCVFAFKLAHMLYVGNIGDSRCVVCRQAENGDLQAIGLSIDQKPDNPREKARILKAGGRVEPLPGPPGEDCGPPRVWLAEVDVPGIAMCLKKGTLVALPDGTPIACENVTAGSHLVGSDGRPVLVTSVSQRLARDVYEVRAKHSMPFIVTAEHKLTLRWSADMDILHRVPSSSSSCELGTLPMVVGEFCAKSDQRLVRRLFQYLPPGTDLETLFGGSHARHRRFIWPSEELALLAARQFVARKKAAGFTCVLGAAQRRADHQRRRFEVDFRFDDDSQTPAATRVFTFDETTHKEHEYAPILVDATEADAVAAALDWLSSVPNALKMTPGDLVEVTAEQFATESVWRHLSTRTTAAVCEQALDASKVVTLSRTSLVDLAPLATFSRTTECASLATARAEEVVQPLASVGSDRSSHAAAAAAAMEEEACDLVVAVHHPLTPQSVLHADSLRALTRAQIEKACASLQIEAESGLVIALKQLTLVPMVDEDAVTLLARHEDACLQSLLASLRSGVRVILSLGAHHDDDDAHLRAGLTVVERRWMDDASTECRLVRFEEREAWLVHSPAQPTTLDHFHAVRRALRIAHHLARTPEATLAKEEEEKRSLVCMSSPAWLSVTKVPPPTLAEPLVPIVSLEVGGDHRYLLADGTITHNSRSIGDEVSQTVGVISVPELIPHQVDPSDIFLLLATDGVWEFLSNEQACAIVWKYKHDLQEAANRLVEEAVARWRKEEDVCDDITVVVVQLNPPRGLPPITNAE